MKALPESQRVVIAKAAILWYRGWWCKMKWEMQVYCDLVDSSISIVPRLFAFIAVLMKNASVKINISLNCKHTNFYVEQIDIEFVQPIVTGSQQNSILDINICDEWFGENMMIDNKLEIGECLLNKYMFQKWGDW